MSSDLATLLQRAHSGEVLGEALFATLATSASDAQERRKLEACRLLEEQTAATIAELAADLGVPLAGEGRVAADEAARDGRRGAEALAPLPWAECMAAVASGTGTYRSLYAELVGVVPDPDDARIAAVVAHEHALTGFARAEAEGDPAGFEALVAALTPENRARLTDG